MLIIQASRPHPNFGCDTGHPLFLLSSSLQVLRLPLAIFRTCSIRGLVQNILTDLGVDGVRDGKLSTSRRVPFSRVCSGLRAADLHSKVLTEGLLIASSRPS